MSLLQKMAESPDFRLRLAKLKNEHGVTPAALEIIEKHRKLDETMKRLIYSFNDCKDGKDMYALCKIMVRMKRVRDLFERQKESCEEMMQREGPIEKLTIVVNCIEASLGHIRVMQDTYQNIQMNFYTKPTKKWYSWKQ